MNFTLITGASKGIGRALAHEFAKVSCNLFLVARSEGALRELSGELEQLYKIKTHYLPMDLLEEGAPERLAQYCRQEGIRPRILVNNAGYGQWEHFAESDLEKQLGMVDLNQKVLMSLCYHFIPLLEEMPEAHILNVSSVAAFQPLAGFSVYAATKAFVFSFSQSLRYELRERGINVSCLCPGPTETEFFSNAQFNHKLSEAQGIKMSAQEVARQGVEGLLTRKAVIIPGFSNKLGAWFSKHLPAGLTTGIVGRLIKYQPAKP